MYNTLSDGKITDSQKRAENVIYQMVAQNGGQDVSSSLPLGIAAPLREAARTCQLAPPSNWPLEAYRAIGRNDLAASAQQNPEVFITDGYKSRKEFVVSIPSFLTHIVIHSITSLRIPARHPKQLVKLQQKFGHWPLSSMVPLVSSST